ncbi:hypothetical protein [Hymenobacter convexus]|uniref:hypothetical protein n=1 Tax=Hymenobacter sp. CA1UV-4 TaxID=3063782 RepID=UPI0027128B32|nr:hypothetical protein [Hymenobacter sp. CA1UV-4]MDO7850019.1 hypothetical protein [Hymenobacter sp. CA1UV-4]
MFGGGGIDFGFDLRNTSTARYGNGQSRIIAYRPSNTVPVYQVPIYVEGTSDFLGPVLQLPMAYLEAGLRHQRFTVSLDVGTGETVDCPDNLTVNELLRDQNGYPIRAVFSHREPLDVASERGLSLRAQHQIANGRYAS